MVLVLPAVAAIVIALLAILIILGGAAFKRLFGATVGQLPLVGGYLSTIMDAAFNAATSTLEKWAQSAGGAIADALAGVVDHFWSIDSAATDAIGNMVGAAGRLSTRLWNTAASLSAQIAATAATLSGAVLWWVGVLRSEAAAMEARIDGAVLWWVGQLQGAIASAVATAQGLFTRAEADAQAAAAAAQAAAIDTARSLFTSAEAHVVAVESEAMGAVKALGVEVSAEISAAEAQAIAAAGTLAATAAAGALHSLDVAAHDVVIGPWEALLPDLEAIIGHLPAEITQALPQLGALPRDLPLSLPAILGLLAPAIAGTVTETARCTVPMCTNLGGLSNLFRGLQDAALWALLAALLAEAVHDPGVVAQDAQDAFAAPVMAAWHGVRDLVGV